MLNFLRAPIVRVGLVIAASATLATLWLVMDLPIAILPGLFVPIWLPLFQSNRPSPARKRLPITLTVVGVVVLAAVAVVFTVIYFSVR